MSQSDDKEAFTRKRVDTDTSSQEQLQGTAVPGKPEARNPRLPHEQDESTSGTGIRHEKPARTGSEIAQAAEDVERGLVDTERRGIPSDLPGPKSN